MSKYSSFPYCMHVVHTITRMTGDVDCNLSQLTISVAPSSLVSRQDIVQRTIPQHRSTPMALTQNRKPLRNQSSAFGREDPILLSARRFSLPLLVLDDSVLLHIRRLSSSSSSSLCRGDGIIRQIEPPAPSVHQIEKLLQKRIPAQRVFTPHDQQFRPRPRKGHVDPPPVLEQIAHVAGRVAAH